MFLLVVIAQDKPQCNEDVLVLQLAELQAINPENIINLAFTEELEYMCR